MDTDELKKLASKLPKGYHLVYQDASEMFKVLDPKRQTVIVRPLERVDKWRDPASTMAFATKHQERIRRIR